jgi:hypothetical protein
MTTTGKVSEINLRRSESDPGFLILGPDRNVWATTAAHTPSYFSAYQIFKVVANRRLQVYSVDASDFPSNLVTIDRQLYFGTNLIVDISGSTRYQNSVATVSTKGDITDVFQVGADGFKPNTWLNAVSTPGPLVWLYSDGGLLSACSLKGDCKLTQTAYAEQFVDNLHPDSLAYSPADGDVYVANDYTSSVYKFSNKDKLLKTYHNEVFALGFDALTYFSEAIWISLGTDASGKPLLGRIAPSGSISLFALPIPKATALVSAIVAGPGGHLWYLRGGSVGEILTKL